MTTTVQPTADAAPAGLAQTAPTLRLRPALVNGQRIHVECASWCTEDHIAENARHLEDVCHSSVAVDLMSPRDNGPAKLLAYARVISGDSGSMEDRPQVTVDFDDIHGMYLQVQDVEELADNLIAFAQRIRSLGRVIAVTA
mgnify:CR=1 FL=1